MDLKKLITDGYERKARLYPAFVLLAPIIVTVIAIVPERGSLLKYLIAPVLGCGGAFLLAQLVRDAGKKIENELFIKWDGMPSVSIFRHRDSRIDSITKTRYHKKLASLVKEVKPPTIAQEEADPKAADEVYTAWSTYIRTKTRDTKKYPLLFQENINYGYRRNVLGIRKIGIVTSILCVGIAGIRLCLKSGSISEEPTTLIALIVSSIILLLWLFTVTDKWVRATADAYTLRLAELSESFDKKPATEKKPATTKK